MHIYSCSNFELGQYLQIMYKEVLKPRPYPMLSLHTFHICTGQEKQNWVLVSFESNSQESNLVKVVEKKSVSNVKLEKVLMKLWAWLKVAQIPILLSFKINKGPSILLCRIVYLNIWLNWRKVLSVLHDRSHSPGNQSFQRPIAIYRINSQFVLTDGCCLSL